MKFTGQASILSGIKATSGEVEGNKYSSTTFYLPADLNNSSNVKALGSVVVPYKFGDVTEFDKWKHLENSWPAAGLPVLCDFDVVQGKDAQGKDTAKLQLIGIRPAPSAPIGKSV